MSYNKKGYEKASKADEKVSKEYVERIKAGGNVRRVCIEEIYQQFFGYVVALANQYRLSREDVMSIYNQAVAELVYRIDIGTFKVKSPKACSSFIYTVTENLCNTLNKKGYNFISIDDEELREIVRTNSEDFQIEELPKITGHFEKGKWNSLWQNESLSISFGQLSPKCQKVLRLWAEGYSMHEIVKIVETISNANQASVTKYRCLDELKKLIDKYSTNQ